MPIVHIEKRDRWSPIANITLEDTRLSFKARGLLAYLLAKPDTWSANIVQLCHASEHDGEKSIRAALRELTEYGYATFERLRIAGKYVEGGWIIREQPHADFRYVVKEQEKQTPTPSAHFRHVEKRHVEKGKVVSSFSPSDSPSYISHQEGKTEGRKDLEENYPQKTEDSLSGNETGLIPGPPPPPTRVHAASKKQPLAPEDWLAIWLQQQDLLEIPFAFLNDEKWWAAASILITDGFNEAWLERQFAKMVLHFQKPGERQPRTEAGWKRFLTHWFQLADKIEQREKRQEKLYGTQTQTRR